MEWQLVLALLFATMLALMATGIPIALALILTDLVWAFVLWGGHTGLIQITYSIAGSVTKFALLPIPLFVLMGEVMFHTRLGIDMIQAASQWMGRIAGRLSLLAVGTGVILATLTGASVSAVAILGTTLLPDMVSREYKKPMTIGPILGSGGLAIMIPPSAMAVLLGAVAQVSIAELLIAIIVPGIVMAGLYAAYIVVRCSIDPSLAPAYEIASVPLSVKLRDTIRYLVPLGFVIVMVTGVIFLGLTTPSEAAATGALATFIIALAYGRADKSTVVNAIASTVRITGMMFLIVVGATVFSQLLATTGGGRGLAELAVGLPVPPLVIILAMMAVVLVMGCFMDVLAIMMITLPIFMPVVKALHYDPIWFCVLFMINLEVALISPPFGMSLFVMKGVAPEDYTIQDIYVGALPFVLLDLLAMALIILFPDIALWLPSRMR